MMEEVKYVLTWEAKRASFFLKFRQFSLKTNFLANNCLIYKHQFQLHHRGTHAFLWETMTNYSSGQSFLLKGSPPNYFNTFFREWIRKKKKTFWEEKNPFGQQFEQPPWHHTKINIPESCLKDVFRFLSQPRADQVDTLGRKKKNCARRDTSAGSEQNRKILRIEDKHWTNDRINAPVLFHYRRLNQEDADGERAL